MNLAIERERAGTDIIRVQKPGDRDISPAVQQYLIRAEFNLQQLHNHRAISYRSTAVTFYQVVCIPVIVVVVQLQALVHLVQQFSVNTKKKYYYRGP